MWAAGPWGHSERRKISLGFPDGTVVRNLPTSTGDARDTGLILGLERSPVGGNGNPLQYSCLENSMNRRTWQDTVHGVTNSWTWLSNWAHTGHQIAATPWGEPHGSSGCEEHRTLTPGLMVWCMWKGFQWIQTFASPQEIDTFLNLGDLVFFKSFFDAQTTCPLLQNFCITWLLPSPPHSSSLRVTWDAASWSWIPKISTADT